MNKLNVLYEDNHIIVAVKPANIPSQADISGDIDMLTMVKEYVKDMVEKKQMAVVFSDHNLDEVKALCNRLVVIRNGKKFMMGI